MKPISTLLLLAALMFGAVLAPVQTPLLLTLLAAAASLYYVPNIYISWRGPDESVGSVPYSVYRSLGDISHFDLK